MYDVCAERRDEVTERAAPKGVTSDRVIGNLGELWPILVAAVGLGKVTRSKRYRAGRTP